MRVDFSRNKVKPRKILFKIYNCSIVVDILFPSVCGSCILVTGAAVFIFVYDQIGEYLANSWSSVRRAVESAQKFYSINCYSDVSTFELS